MSIIQEIWAMHVQEHFNQPYSLLEDILGRYIYYNSKLNRIELFPEKKKYKYINKRRYDYIGDLWGINENSVQIRQTNSSTGIKKTIQS